MSRRTKHQHGRYEVTGPGVEGKQYEAFGPALSFSVTKASAAQVDSTYYVRDFNGGIVGYSEKHADTNSVITVAHPQAKEKS